MFKEKVFMCSPVHGLAFVRLLAVAATSPVSTSGSGAHRVFQLGTHCQVQLGKAAVLVSLHRAA